MKTLTIFSRAFALGLCVAVGAAFSSAQGYYDDDIYFDASKVKTDKKAEKKSRGSNKYDGQYYYDGAQYVPWNNVGDYQAADTYQVTGTSTRDVDEYNRRTSAPVSSQVPDSISLEQFEEMSNTRNLARFHNSAQAQQAYADNMELSGYADGYDLMPQASTTVINLNVVDPFYSYPYYGYYGSYWSRPWYWNSWAYDPWYWGPSWSYGPSWSWGWGGPSWSWGWGGPHPGWHHPGWIHPRPNYTSSGAYAPNTTHRPSSTGTYRPNGGNRFNSGNTSTGTRGSAASSLGTRPNYRNGASGAVNRGSGQSTERPGYKSPTYRPGGTTQSGNVTRGRTVGTQNQSAPRQSNSSTNYNRNSNSYNSGSFGTGSSRGRSGSSGSFGGSSRGSHSGGGVSRGGGGHRGR